MALDEPTRDVRGAVADPATWGAPAGTPVQVRETHSSWVALVGDRAFKVKKPVRLPFLDFGTLEARRAACEAEVALNRRLAPEVYLGVRALVPRRGGGGLVVAAPDAPAAVEVAVEMRRFDERATLAARLAAGPGVGAAALVALGAHLARFHADAPADRGRHGAERVKRVVDDTFATLRDAHGAGAAQWRLAALERFFGAVLADRWGELDARALGGRVREGHGDLRAEHVLLDDALTIVDCLEFDRALRCIDVAEDLGFLVMDLAAARRDDLVEALLEGYREAGGDPGDDGLVWAFAVARALVRAKVERLRAAQLRGPPAAERLAAADGFEALAERAAWRARGPVALAVAGPAASGKSTLAAALAARSGLAVHASDAVRKRRAGLAPTERAPDALYGEAVSRRTYAALRAAARDDLARGRGVVVDATFRDPAERAALERWATAAGARLLVVECRVPPAELERRAAARLCDPGRVSDAGPAVARAQAAAWTPWDPPRPGDGLVVRADGDPQALVDVVADAVDRRPPESGDGAHPTQEVRPWPA